MVKDAWATFVSDSRIFKINSAWCGGYHALQILAQSPKQCVLVERNLPWQCVAIERIWWSPLCPLSSNPLSWMTFSMATRSPLVQPAHEVLLSGWFLGIIWLALFKVQNAWMFSMRNPRLVKTKVIRVLTGAKTSWTISFF